MHGDPHQHITTVRDKSVTRLMQIHFIFTLSRVFNKEMDTERKKVLIKGRGQVFLKFLVIFLHDNTELKVWTKF